MFRVMGVMYNTEYDKKKMARACKRWVRISHKAASEVARHVAGMKVEKAKRFLMDIVKMRRAVPFRRYNSDLAHKPGIGAGRYPVGVAREILDLVESAEKNAENLGLDVSRLYIRSLLVMKASTFRRPRRSGLSPHTRKNVHLSIVLEER